VSPQECLLKNMFALVGNFEMKKLFYCTRQNIFAPQTSIFIMLPITGNKQNLGATDHCKRQIETSKYIFGSTAEGTARTYYPYVKTFYCVSLLRFLYRIRSDVGI